MSNLQEAKRLAKLAVQAEGLGKIDGYFGGQRGKNAALGHAMLALFDHIIEGKDCLEELRYAKNRMLHYDAIETEMYMVCAAIDECETEECIEGLAPNWPIPPIR